MTKNNSNISVQLKISYLEIYNEHVNDLLNPENKNLQLLEIKENKNQERNVLIKNLTTKITDSPEKAIELL